MNKNGLITEPDFSNLELYLTSGRRTEITPEIERVADGITGNTEGLIVRNIIVWINKNTVRINNGNDTRKFKRSATEILESRERTGCCDSSTLFTAIARAKGISTMQIITFDKAWAEKIEKGEKTDTSGHYYVGCYLHDIEGKGRWTLLDPDNPNITDIRDVSIKRLDEESRNIDRGRYAFAYVRDYSDIEAFGTKINSIQEMNQVQYLAYRECDKQDFKIRENENQK